MAQGTLPLDYPEFMLLLKASMLMPKEEANISLRAIRENLFKTSRPNSRDEKRIKVFLYGAILEDASILKSLENSRMGVFMDNLYNGTRYFLHDVDETVDPIRALVQRHFRKDPLSVYHYSKDRLRNYFDSVITTNQIDAFIFLAPMYCEPMEFDFPFVKDLAEKSGVPVLFLETDFSSSNAQLFTKLEAFLEMLGGY
jgi:benzoyl-CoA reductase subunit C